eukprot:Phypoly_transcript_13930.p1 GENE.Phypoly_transcript_13930~~Phypoly_transcript_13930.p1  ORF type:complete len:281 (+),score=55.97 Phypoly_transcript_13930:33-845(+)
MAGLTDVKKVDLTTPFGAPSDSYVIGTLGAHRVAFLPRHGVGHKYLPHEIPARANIHGFKQLGVKYLISVSAVGSLREEFAPGDVVVPDQIFDRTKGIRPLSFFGEGIAAHVQFDKPFDFQLSKLLENASKEAGANVHGLGTYVCMEGPQFSTYAESQEYRRMGFDIIGMTAIPEAKLAREAEIAYACCAFVTDYDCWRPSEGVVDVEKVIAVLHKNVALAQTIIANVVPKIGDFESPAHSALKHSIITRKDVMPPAKLEQLKLLLQNYV